ncbi:MAG: hypothetical protein ACP5SH_00290 [Syntrophobacteraceae bacterium]
MKHSIPIKDAAKIVTELANRPVVLFGAGVLAAASIYALREHGIIPVCICDNDINKYGTQICDISVTSPESLTNNFQNLPVVITANPMYLDEIRNQLTTLGCSNIYDIAPFLSSCSYDGSSFPIGISHFNFCLDKYFHIYFKTFYPELCVIPSLDIVITEKCSLRCKDCANLIQYYHKPHHFTYDQVFPALDRIMDAVDFVLEFRVLGGETFMHPKAYIFIDALRKYTNYGKICVYSNGTIVPTGENLRSLQHDDTFVRISDYGQTSTNIDTIASTFDRHNICYDIEKCEQWQDCASIRKTDRSRQELEAVNAECCARTVLTLLNGAICVCPFSAHATNLHAIPVSSRDRLVVGDSALDKIRAFLKDTQNSNYFEACMYCAGRPVNPPNPVPAAVQISSPLPYQTVED